MFASPSSIDPVDCGCEDCFSGSSRPFSRYGDVGQFHLLLHGDVQDATGDRDYAWMDVAAELCPERFVEWLVAEFRARRVLSLPKLQAKAAATVLGPLLDDR